MTIVHWTTYNVGGENMTPDLGLINFEQLANTSFLISTMYAYSSGNQAAQRELEKVQETSPYTSASTAEKSAQFALISTYFSAAAYFILTLVSITRRNQLERGILEGTSNVSIGPTTNIILGFAFALVGAIIRLPALQQRVREAQEVIL